MGISGIAVTLMLVYVQSAIGETGQPFNCNNFVDVFMKEWYCRPVGLFTLSYDVMDDGILTREELLEGVHGKCSNETLLETYFDCLEDLVVECPVQSVFLLDGIEDKLAMFCDGSNVSEWLLTTVQNGYSFNQECVPASMELIQTCGKEVPTSLQNDEIGNLSLTTALELWPQAVSNVFHCTENAFSQIPASNQECGSSWQDMLLTAWLQMSSQAGFGGNLSYEDRLRLQALKIGQTVQ